MKNDRPILYVKHELLGKGKGTFILKVIGYWKSVSQCYEKYNYLKINLIRFK